MTAPHKIPGAGSEPVEVEAATLPCNWEKFSGTCMVCGAGPDEECEIERERRASFRVQERAFTGDSIHATLQTYLVIAAGPNAPEPALNPESGGIFLPPAPDGTYTQGLSVGVDPAGYLLTAAHVLRERNFVIGWIDGRLEILPARVLADIERRTGRRIAELFDVIAGTSTGGIIACGLAKPDPGGTDDEHRAFAIESPPCRHQCGEHQCREKNELGQGPLSQAHRKPSAVDKRTGGEPTNRERPDSAGTAGR